MFVSIPLGTTAVPRFRRLRRSIKAVPDHHEIKPHPQSAAGRSLCSALPAGSLACRGERAPSPSGRALPAPPACRCTSGPCASPRQPAAGSWRWRRADCGPHWIHTASQTLYLEALGRTKDRSLLPHSDVNTEITNSKPGTTCDRYIYHPLEMTILFEEPEHPNQAKV